MGEKNSSYHHRKLHLEFVNDLQAFLGSRLQDKAMECCFFHFVLFEL